MNIFFKKLVGRLLFFFGGLLTFFAVVAIIGGGGVNILITLMALGAGLFLVTVGVLIRFV